MRTFILILLLISTIQACTSPGVKTTDQKKENVVVYDSVLAAQLGSDTYGMKKYVLAFLKRGPNRNQDSAEAAALQKAHLQNIGRMADEGKLVVAGPFLDDQDIRGIYIFNVETVEEAQQLTETDPAIKAGRLVMELHPWYGSAAMMMINEWHKKLEKKSVAD